MTQPSTGTTMQAGGFIDLDNRFSGRTGLMQVLIRDARGGDTDISPHNSDGSVRFSPLAQDGKIRNDLLACKRVNGIWVENPEPNLGFHIIGAFAEGSGPSSKPSIDTDDQMVEQSRQPYDSDRTKEDEPFSFTGIEIHRPTIRRLRNDLPLNRADGTAILDEIGKEGAGWGKRLDADPVDRQILAVYARSRGGRTLYDVTGFALAGLNNIGDSKRGKKENGAAELTYKPLPDGYFMAMIDGEYVPVIKYEWIGGDAWTALGTPTPASYDVILGAQSSGTFVLTFRGRTTAPIAYGATPANVKTALVALDDGFDAAAWTVTGSTGGPFEVTTPGGALTGSGASLGTPGSFEIEPAA